MTNLVEMGQAAKQASRRLAVLSTDQKNQALLAIASELRQQAGQVLDANAQDVADARERGLSEALVDRLLLTEDRIAGMVAGTRHVVGLPDPVGQEFDTHVQPNGMRTGKRRTPIGVLGAIYEARPNITIDIAALCLKTGNAAILRGSGETLRSNLALVAIIHAALAQVGLPREAIQYIEDPDRALVTELLRLDRYVDMIVPRGGAGLHQLCREQSTIPVITGGIGICHIYVDESADLDRAVDIVENAKVQRPSVCNALDTVLVHLRVAAAFLPPMAARLAQSDVEIRADGQALALLQDGDHGATLVPAGPEDFDQMQVGSILVASATTPAWTPLFAMASAVVTDVGGPLSHGSIVAREYGIPAVMGTGSATKLIESGQTITVCGDTGEVLLANGNGVAR